MVSLESFCLSEPPAAFLGFANFSDSKTGKSKEDLMRILNVAEQEGKLLRIDGDLMFTNTNFIQLKDRVKTYFATQENMSVSEFKELANTSRKYAVPLLEYLDKKKITFREGNFRKLVE